MDSCTLVNERADNTAPCDTHSNVPNDTHNTVPNDTQNTVPNDTPNNLVTMDSEQDSSSQPRRISRVRTRSQSSSQDSSPNLHGTRRKSQKISRNSMASNTAESRAKSHCESSNGVPPLYAGMRDYSYLARHHGNRPKTAVVQQREDPNRVMSTAVIRTPHKMEEIETDGTLPKVIRDTPLKAMHASSKKMMAVKLDPDTQLMNEDGRLLNWEGLAEYMNLAPDVIDYIAANRETKTSTIIDTWNRQTAHKMGELWQLLHKLERWDVVRDPYLYRKFRSDAKHYYIRIEDEKIRAARNWFPKIRCKPQKVTDEKEQDVRIDPCEAMKIRRDECADENDVIVVQDIDAGPNAPKVIFDAYVSYCDKNMTFVAELIRFLEDKHGLKLCIKERDLLAGSATHYAVAHLIKHRCKKMIAVMSPDYLNSAECDYQTKVALALNRTPIILMYEECEVPPAINFMCILRHNELPADWFWKRLQKAVQDERSCIFQAPGSNTSAPDFIPTSLRKRREIPKSIRAVFQCVLPQRSRTSGRQLERNRTTDITKTKQSDKICSGCGNGDKCACAKRSKMAEDAPEVIELPDLISDGTETKAGKIKSPRPSVKRHCCGREGLLDRCPSIEEMKNAAMIDERPMVYTGKNAFRGCFPQPSLRRFEDQSDLEDDEILAELNPNSPRRKRDPVNRVPSYKPVRHGIIPLSEQRASGLLERNDEIPVSGNGEITVSEHGGIPVSGNGQITVSENGEISVSGPENNRSSDSNFGNVLATQTSLETSKQCSCGANASDGTCSYCEGIDSIKTVDSSKTRDSLIVNHSITTASLRNETLESFEEEKEDCRLYHESRLQQVKMEDVEETNVQTYLNATSDKTNSSNIPLVVLERSIEQTNETATIQIDDTVRADDQNRPVLPQEDTESQKVEKMFRDSEKIFQEVNLFNSMNMRLNNECK